ncbi:MAG: HEPN domain-containing protein [Candidatus Bathyarchaeia archaeon]
MRFNPKAEVGYRVKPAERYLSDAERAFRAGDHRGTVECAQRAAENAAKAVIAVNRVPSWSHDPSHELMDALADLPEEDREGAKTLAGLAHDLSPEHGRATHGEPTRGLTPWELYGRREAESTLSKARTALELMKKILRQPPL